MGSSQDRRRLFAALGLFLAAVFTLGVIRAVLLGETEWWNLVVLLPVAAIAWQLYRRWLQPPPSRD